MRSVFYPCSDAVRSLDAAARAALAESLSYIHTVIAEQIDVAAAELAPTLSGIRAHRISPGVFGRYYDLVFAVQARRYGAAGALIRQIVELAGEAADFAVIPLDALNSDKERYVRLLSLETESSLALAGPSEAEWPVFRERVGAALSLIEEADIALAAELRALVVQVVGAVLAAPAGNRGFGGASSSMLWGAIIVNARLYGETLDMLAALVHEAAHQVLFGHALDQPLVENSVDERYGSPLRIDPRPMDGVVHAVFVCARIHYAYTRLLEGARSSLKLPERELIERRLREHHSKFFDGFETVERFGRMTATGRRILDDAAQYMRIVG